MIQVAHIINPVKVNEFSDLHYAQPITFETMLRARLFSSKKNAIQLYTTQFEEDKSIIPDGFTVLSNLERSVLDVNPALTKRKLPLIADILAKRSEVPDADYLVFTNMDIAVQPYFYDAVFSYIEQGHDAVVINRRRVSDKLRSIEDLPLLYADMGKSHPGFDCFVIKRSLIDQFVMGDVCVGISFLEATLVHNIFSFAENPLFVPDAHLTFHIGMDVLVPRNNAFYWHNRNAFFNDICPKLKPHFDLKKFPYGSLPFPKRAVKWMLNPSLFTRNYINMEGKNFFQRVKTRMDEVRWRILQK
ncbi:MAG: hypothetical protein M9916_10505 [Crocinitomicaceae bacterium]|nr:hypothetical protein [Crocinitomicaceae bacterium]